MIKLLIVDDEPLVQIGVKSMLNWADYGIEVCGTAMNGAAALKMIEEYSPEIVIADIRMPIMNGLELAKTCRDTYGRIPLFIILTSYEEFELARQALSYEVVDYLIKMELDKESLAASIETALKRLKDLKATEAIRAGGRPLLQTYMDKFFLRLLHHQSPVQLRLLRGSGQLRVLKGKLQPLLQGVFFNEIENLQSISRFQELIRQHYLRLLLAAFTGQSFL